MSKSINPNQAGSRKEASASSKTQMLNNAKKEPPSVLTAKKGSNPNNSRPNAITAKTPVVVAKSQPNLNTTRAGDQNMTAQEGIKCRICSLKKPVLIAPCECRGSF